jgi:hypothetical protein
MMPYHTAAQEEPEAIVVEVAESMTDAADLFDEEVDGFGGSVGLAGGVVRQDLVVPGAHGSGQGVELGDPAFVAMAVELVEGPAGCLLVSRRVDLAEKLHGQPGGGHISLGIAQLEAGDEAFPASLVQPFGADEGDTTDPVQGSAARPRWPSVSFWTRRRTLSNARLAR